MKGMAFLFQRNENSASAYTYKHVGELQLRKAACPGAVLIRSESYRAESQEARARIRSDLGLAAAEEYDQCGFLLFYGGAASLDR